MKRLNFYTTNEFKPKGWIKNQLEIQAEGLCGKLNEIWSDIKDSAWIGGMEKEYKKDKQWLAERVPCWLEGYIPLSYMLGDEKMIATAKRYVDSIIALQKADGWICPCTTKEDFEKYDLWTVIILMRAFKVYYECSRDEKIPGVMYKVLKNLYDLLTEEKTRLFEWAHQRWQELFGAITLLYNIYGEEWIRDLAKIMKAQGKDYNTVTEKWKRPLNVWHHDTHIVNLTMMLKSEAASCDMLGEEYTDNAEYLHGILNKYNGTVFGSYTGDECLSGVSPIQGTELCAIAEHMFSAEVLYEYTGDFKWIDRLENLAFNAWPATMSEDMNTHQYCQMSNQISTDAFKGKPIFRTNDEEAHVFTVHYCCCTANHSHGWPKFALSAYAHDENTIISAIPLSGTLDSELAFIDLETDYPFNHQLKYTVKAKKDFTFKIRIPSFSEETTVNGNCYDGTLLSYDLKAGEEREICISLKVTPRFEKTPVGLSAVKYGALIFALPASVEDWEYGYVNNELKVTYNSSGKIPFSLENPPVTVEATVKSIDWGFEDGYDIVCAKLPGSVIPLSGEKKVTLVPYGAAKLRMTEMPVVE